MARALGRRLPGGSARFARVGELFGLTPEEREATELWAPGGSSEWMPLVRLLATPPPYGEASLHAAPSGMVVVVRDRPE